MSEYIGDFAEDATIETKFNTRGTFAGSPAFAIYKGNSVTEITAGITPTIDFDGVANFHQLVIDLSSDAAYAAGEDYTIVVTSGTVGGESAVGQIVRTFSIGNRSVPSVSLGANAPADWINAASIAAGALDGKGNWNVGKTGYSLTATTGLGNQTADITGNLSGSVGSVVGAVGSVTGAVTVGTNNDKTGYALTAGQVTSLAAALEAAIINELDGTAVMQAIADLIAADMTTGDLTVQAIASAVRDAVLNRVLASNHDVNGSVGKVLQDILGDTAALDSRIAGTIRTAADDVTAETAQTAAIRDGLAAATNVSDAQTAIETILGTPSGASLAADIAAIELDPEIIVNPTELSNESIEAIDTYFWENHRFKATIDSETGQFVIWVKNEDGDKIATLAKQEEIIEDIAGIEGGGGGAGDTAEEIVDEIVARGITAIPVQSGVTSAGNLDLIQGDTYNGTAKPLLSFPASVDYTDGWAATLTIRGADDVVVATATGVVASATQVTVSLTAPTGLVFEGCPGVWQGKFDVEVSKGTQRATIARGVAYINEDQTR
jgi:hypothetical protein